VCSSHRNTRRTLPKCEIASSGHPGYHSTKTASPAYFLFGPTRHSVASKFAAHVSGCAASDNHRSISLVRSGFSLVDVLVSISIIAVLISLLVPSLAKVNETARRVVCQSNVRQIGLGLVMYTNDHNGFLPPSRFVSDTASRGLASPEKMVTLRVDETEQGGSVTASTWDGLGILFATEYLSASKVFYCPSHRGQNPHSNYALAWGGQAGEIVCNYHYRGEGPTNRGQAQNGVVPTTRKLWLIDPAQSSLIADSMQVKSDCNHIVGVNFFRADLTVHWYSDPSSSLQEQLPDRKDQAIPAVVFNAWRALDSSAVSGSRGPP